MDETKPEAPAEEVAAPDRNAERTEAVAKVKFTKANKAAKSAAPKATHINFVSANEEPSAFDITVAGNRITPYRDESREYLIWSVPAELADRFALHDHVVKGRIVRET